MTASYGIRLCCLSLSSFFVLHLCLGAAVRLITPFTLKQISRMPMRQAANLSLFVRLFPASFSAFVVAMLCVPSYLRMEPKHTLEPVGAFCLFTSLSGLALLTHSITRSMAAYII